VSGEMLKRWRWRGEDHSHLRRPFPGASGLVRNFSQAWQDIWVLQTLGGLRSGKYIEIGANHPVANNNSYLLSSSFEWRGVSVEYDPSHLPAWASLRPNDTFICADALTLDYLALIKGSFGADCKRIDYLQLDIEPSIKTLEVLRQMPLDHVRFSTITFETDAYSKDQRARSESREVLRAHGYELVVADVLVDYAAVSANPIPFEDWWIDSQLTAELGLTSENMGAFCKPQEVIFA
jgi:hypothetical protein